MRGVLSKEGECFLGVFSSSNNTAPSQSTSIQHTDSSQAFLPQNLAQSSLPSETTSLLRMPPAVLSSTSPAALMSVREKWVARVAVANELTSILCAVVCYSLYTPKGKEVGMGVVPLLVTSLIWNLVSALYHTLRLPDYFKMARESATYSTVKFVFALFSAIYYPVILPAFTLLAFTLAAMQATREEWWTTDRLLGDKTAWVGSDLAFAGDLFFQSIVAFYSWVRAHQKFDEIALLEDRHKKYCAAKENNQNISEEKKSRLSFELRALLIACNMRDELKDKVNVKSAGLNLNLDPRIACIDANYLIHKQRYNARIKGISIFGNMVGCLAAIIGAASTEIDTDPLAKRLLWVSAFLYVFSWAVKYFQVFGPHCSGNPATQDPEKFIREILYPESKGSIHAMVSKTDLTLVKYNSSLWTTPGAFTFYSAPVSTMPTPRESVLSNMGITVGAPSVFSTPPPQISTMPTPREESRCDLASNAGTTVDASSIFSTPPLPQIKTTRAEDDKKGSPISSSEPCTPIKRDNAIGGGHRRQSSLEPQSEVISHLESRFNS